MKLAIAIPPNILVRSAILSAISSSCLYWVSNRICSSKKPEPLAFQCALRVFWDNTDSLARLLVKDFYNRKAHITFQSDIRLDENLQRFWVMTIIIQADDRFCEDLRF